MSNQEIVGRSVENLSRRTHIRRSAEIHLLPETPYEKVEKALAIIREKLTGREIVDSELPPQCYLHEIGREGFSIRYIYWYSPPDITAFHAFAEKLNLEILLAFDAARIPLAGQEMNAAR